MKKVSNPRGQATEVGKRTKIANVTFNLDGNITECEENVNCRLLHKR